MRPGRDDGAPVMGSQVLVDAVEQRLVAMRLHHCALQVVRDKDPRTAAQVFEAVHVRRHPLLQLLRGQRLGVREAGGAEHADEELPGILGAGLGVDHRDRLPGEVEEQLVASVVLVAKHHVEVTCPLPVVMDELGVLVPLRVALLVLHPEKLERDRGPAELTVDRGPVRHRPLGRGRELPSGEELPLQVGVIDVIGERPADPGRGGPAQVLPHRRRANPGHQGHLAVAQPLPVAEAEDFSDLAHGGSGSRHRHLLERLLGRSRQRASAFTSRRHSSLPPVRGNPDLGGRIQPKRLRAFSRSGCADSPKPAANRTPGRPGPQARGRGREQPARGRVAPVGGSLKSQAAQ